MIDQYIAALADYGVRTGLIAPADRTWAVNSLLQAMDLQEYIEPEEHLEAPLEEILQRLLDFSVQRRVIQGDITSRDLFDTKLMGILTPRPSQVIASFRERYARNLTLSRLSEAVILPLSPDKGSCMHYDPSLPASVFLQNDLEMLLRMRNVLQS